MGDIYFNGTALAAGKKVKFNGTDMSNVYFNGTKIWTYYIPSAQSYTSSATYNITGTAPSPTAAQTYNFTLSATDVESQVVTRDFSITISVGATGGGQFN